MRRLLLALVIVFTLSALAASAAPTYTYVDLVHRITDLKYLATLPAVGDTEAQWSSYDRSSKYDEATGKYVRWDANGDGGGYIRPEGEQFVFAEMTGPGVIWRTWSANAAAGHVKIYLDGAAEPTVDLPFSGYFDGKTEPFNYPTLVHKTAANGFNNYVPLPYQKSCKIVADKDWGSYFHFNYETFPAGTVVPTFKMALTAEEKAALAKADEQLSAPPDKRALPLASRVFAVSYDANGVKTTQQMQDLVGVLAGDTTLPTPELTVPAGGKTTAAQIPESGAIVAFVVGVPNVPAEDMEKVLRELAIQIKWDGEEEPSVWSPLGDFFGTGPGLNKYQSYPMGMTDKVLYSFWYMPYAKGARVEVLNDGVVERKLKFSLASEPLKAADVAKLARFHAKWHRDIFNPATPDRAPDWTMLQTTGRGRYVGVALNIWNPRGGWWGEGDEKFFVDGEKFPSTFGTGSEDYFGYAWSSGRLFYHPLHNQPRNDNQANNGHVSVSRWHMADAIPFQNSFEAAIEKYWDDKRPTQYDCIAYWYQEGGQDPYAPVPFADRWDYYTKLGVSKNAAGALEAESLIVLEGQSAPQGMEGFGADKWSDNRQLWWTPGKPNVKLVLALPVDKDGKYQLTTVLTKAIDYGIAQLYLDDKKLGDPIDLFNDGVIPTPVIDLGAFDLTKGDHRLTVEMIGKNDAAKPGYMFGMDYLKLTPLP